MYLIDANVFLEILLTQERGKECKRFLDAAIGNLYIK
jgi:predicted nucleic acid-binding protein